MDRRIAWLLALALISGAMPAQARPVSAGLELGGRFGAFVDDPQLFDSDWHRAWSARVVVEWPARARWSLASGVGYEEVGSTVTYTIGTTGGWIRDRVHGALGYLGVPLCARWRPIRARPLFLQLGPEIGYLERVFETSDVQATESPVARPAIAGVPAAQIFESGPPPPRDPYFPWAAFLDSSIGWEFPFGAHRIVARARWVEGLTDVLRSEDFRRSTRAVEVAAGWTW